MERNRNQFPPFLNVLIYLDRGRDTSVVPRFAKDFDGYEKVVDAPDILVLSMIHPERDALTCSYKKMQDNESSDARLGRLRGLHYIIQDQPFPFNNSQLYNTL
jgi:hypothetical protein